VTNWYCVIEPSVCTYHMSRIKCYNMICYIIYDVIQYNFIYNISYYILYSISLIMIYDMHTCTYHENYFSFSNHFGIFFLNKKTHKSICHIEIVHLFS